MLCDRDGGVQRWRAASRHQEWSRLDFNRRRGVQHWEILLPDGAKLFALTLSSAMAGLAGVLYAHYVLTPSIVAFSEMARIIIIVVIGGLGSLVGPVLAAPPINFLATYLQQYGEWSLVLFAAIVIVVMRSHPAGLVGLIESAMRRWRGTE